MMNTSRASGAILNVDIGGQRRSLRRLSRRDFGVLIERMPGESKTFVSPFDINRWAGTVDGAPAIIAVASLAVGYAPADLDARIAEVSTDGGEWGSFVAQAQIAAYVTAESLTHGDASPDAPSEGKKCADPTRTAATTQRKRSGFLAGVRAWATRGR